MKEIKRAMLVDNMLRPVLNNNAVSNSVYLHKIAEGYEIIPGDIFEFETEASQAENDNGTFRWDHLAFPVVPFKRIK